MLNDQSTGCTVLLRNFKDSEIRSYAGNVRIANHIGKGLLSQRKRN